MYWAEKTRCFRQRKSSCSWNRYFCRPPRPWDSSGKNIGVGCHFLPQCMKVKSESQVAQSCPTLRDSMDCSLPGSSVHGISQARVLEWGAFAFSSGNRHLHLNLWPYQADPSVLLFISKNSLTHHLACNNSINKLLSGPGVC